MPTQCTTTRLIMTALTTVHYALWPMLRDGDVLRTLQCNRRLYEMISNYRVINKLIAFATLAAYQIQHPRITTMMLDKWDNFYHPRLYAAMPTEIIVSAADCGQPRPALHVGDDDVVLSSSVTSLDFSYQRFDIDGAKAIVRILQRNPAIQVLNLASTDINDDHMGAVATALQQSKLHTLDLQRNAQSGPFCMKVISTVVQCSTSLKQLTLGHNRIDCDGAKMLAAALQHNTSLEYLVLSYNQITAAGAQAICKALLHNTSLQMLDLSVNKINADGAYAIAELLRHNTTLQTLS